MSPYISKNQHDFTPKMLISTNLLLFQSKILEVLIMIMLNYRFNYFKKKLSAFGIHGDFLNWIKSYLISRSQARHISDYFIVTSGVPQSSHLGPLLFI